MDCLPATDHHTKNWPISVFDFSFGISSDSLLFLAFCSSGHRWGFGHIQGWLRGEDKLRRQDSNTVRNDERSNRRRVEKQVPAYYWHASKNHLCIWILFWILPWIQIKARNVSAIWYYLNINLYQLNYKCEVNQRLPLTGLASHQNSKTQVEVLHIAKSLSRKVKVGFSFAHFQKMTHMFWYCFWRTYFLLKYIALPQFLFGQEKNVYLFLESIWFKLSSSQWHVAR